MSEAAEASHPTAPLPEALNACTRAWFERVFDAPTEVQAGAWPAILAGRNALLFAPTGSGKTLAAFLAVLDRLMFGPPPVLGEGETHPGIRVLYVSPLKALGVDVDRNLRAPLTGISAVALSRGVPVVAPEVGVRTGDTPSRERARMARQPPDILITTPESLYLMLTSKAREVLARVETVIVDEVHSLLPTKRGAHLALSLERLEAIRLVRDPEAPPLQRIGLSATQRPADEAQRFLGGVDIDADGVVRYRPVDVIDARRPPRLALSVEMPLEEMLAQDPAPRADPDSDDLPPHPEGPWAEDEGVQGDDPDAAFAAGNLARGPLPPSIWPAIYPRLIDLVTAHRSTIVFVNSRRLAERISAAINEEVEHELSRPHHGSLARTTRQETEDLLKTGQLRAIIATSSLELGIDMGAVDLVVQIESPGSIASGLQRIGRAGHSVDAVSNGVVFPKYRGDLLAAAAATAEMKRGNIERTRYLRNPLDVLAQQVVAAIADGHQTPVEQLYAMVRGAAPFAELPRASFVEVLDLLSGRYPSDGFSELKPRITWDRITDTLTPRKGAQRTAILNGGTIPDRGLFGVFLGQGSESATRRSRVGELDEEMVYELTPGEVFRLGASSWRVVEITKDQVIVDPAPGEPGKMPFWRGEGLGRTLEFGQAIGRLTREIDEAPRARAIATLISAHDLTEGAAGILVDYVKAQREAAGAVPTDRAIVLERFRDEIGDWRVVLMTPFGARVHAPWAMCAARRLRTRFVDVDVVWTDDGIVFRIPDAESLPAPEDFLPDPETLEDEVTEGLADTSLFAARFRENAARALLLPRQSPTKRTPLWLQRRKASDLLKVASRFPSFPILLETYRECLTDVLDLPGLTEISKRVRARDIALDEVETGAPSPFAQTILFDFTGSFIYETDAPLAERRAQALALDHAQLKELIGAPDYRELLDPAALDELALELARLERPVIGDVDDVHDLLLSLGDLSADELDARRNAERASEADVTGFIRTLVDARRVVALKIAGETRYVAVEEAARYRDATGAVLPLGLPHTLLDPVPDALVELVARYARTHVGFGLADVTTRFGVDPGRARRALDALTAAGRIVDGEFTPGARHEEWIDRQVLGRAKQRSLAKLRRAIEPVAAPAFARFLIGWQRVGGRGRGLDAVLDAVEQLQGLPLLASVLESEILPARVANYHAGMLDELCLSGEVIWRGVESVGPSDGRIALYIADRYEHLALPPDGSLSAAAEAILDELAAGGALQFPEIVTRVGGQAPDLVSALWELVFAGRASNDALAALRSHLKLDRPREVSGAGLRRRRGRAHRFRSRRRDFVPGTEGRWFALPGMPGDDDADAPTPTERAQAIARQLIERHGVVTRETAAFEGVPGGFSQLYPVYRQMEDAGTVRRGYFIEHLGASQFALPPVIDTLRREEDTRPAPVVLAATDPANPYGAVLPWPERAAGTRPARTAGARVVLAGGACLAYLARGGQSLVTFLPQDAAARDRAMRAIAEGLIQIATRFGPVFLEEIDGRAPDDSPLEATLVAAGGTSGYRGLRIAPVEASGA